MNKKILIIEDEPALLKILVDKFTKEGFDTISAINGKEGLESALKNHPDIILLDIIMPVMDGMAVLDELRKDPWGKNARVIVLTNLSDTEKAIKSLKQGVSDYWIKCDMTIDTIVNKVKEKLASGK